ncbi:MAG: hypothetical protein SGCHY_001734, partial [Lobulomycetales sp.]
MDHLQSQPEGRVGRHVEALVNLLRRRQIAGSFHVATETLKLLRTVISNSKWSTADQIIQIVQDTGEKLQHAQPIELAVKNITGRVLTLIRQEYDILYPPDDVNTDPYPFLGSDVSINPNLRRDYTRNCYALKAEIIEGIREIMFELESTDANIAAQSLEHIHSNEIILTIGHSSTVLNFLKEAAKSRKFQVIVCETAPFFLGHQMARQLAEFGIETTLVTDSAVFAIMSRVNKVILGTHAVTANG